MTFLRIKVYLYLLETSEERENPYKSLDRSKIKVKNRDKEKKTQTPVDEADKTIEDCKFNFYIW